MFRHQKLDGLTRYCPKKIDKAPCTICYTEKMTTTPKGTTVDTSNFQPGENFHMEFAFYNVTSIHGFTSMLTGFCENTRMLWVFPAAYKISPVRITRFILTIPNNEQHPYKHVRVDEYVALANYIDVTNLIV